MQLSFLGQSYEVHHPSVEVSETSETAKFLGQAYLRKQYQVEQSQMPPEELIFMGQRYTRVDSTRSLPCKPRPGEKATNGAQMLSLQRSRWSGRRHPAFRG